MCVSVRVCALVHMGLINMQSILAKDHYSKGVLKVDNQLTVGLFSRLKHSDQISQNTNE